MISRSEIWELHSGAQRNRHLSASLCGEPTCLLICSRNGHVWRDQRKRSPRKGWRPRCWRWCRYSRFPLLVCICARSSDIVTFPPELICFVLGLIVQWVDISCLAAKCHQLLLEPPGTLQYRFYRPAVDVLGRRPRRAAWISAEHRFVY